MLRGTCPEDLQEINATRLTRAPSPWIVIGPAFLVLVGVVLVGALHAFLGHPLGETFALQVWDLARQMLFPTLVAASFGVYVTRQHADHGPHRLPPGEGLPPRSLTPTAQTDSYRVVQIAVVDEQADERDRKESERP